MTRRQFFAAVAACVAVPASAQRAPVTDGVRFVAEYSPEHPRGYRIVAYGVPVPQEAA